MSAGHDTPSDEEVWNFIGSRIDGELSMLGSRDESGVREAGVITADAAELQAELDAQWPGAVRLHVISTSPYRDGTSVWECWSVDSSGRELTVHWMGGGGERQHVVEVSEAGDSVTVLINAELYVGAVAAVGVPSERTVRLLDPLRDRAVIDGSTGDVRPRGRGPR